MRKSAKYPDWAIEVDLVGKEVVYRFADRASYHDPEEPGELFRDPF